MVKAEIEIGEQSYPVTGELTTLLRLLSKPNALKLLYQAEIGIKNSTHVIKELNITQKIYYARLRELIDADLVKKKDGVYEQTGLGKIMYNRFLPEMGKAVDSKEKLELLAGLEGMEIENGIRKRILDKLDIPGFASLSNVRMLGDYESLAIAAIDLYDSAEESVLLASNYFDVRVIEAFFRALDRGVINRAIIGKNSRSSKIQSLRTMLSVTFAKVVLNYTSNIEEVKNTVRFADIPYTFCVVDGHHSILEVFDILNERFIVALLIDDRVVGERLTEYYEKFWEAGEFQSAVETINHLNSS